MTDTRQLAPEQATRLNEFARACKAAARAVALYPPAHPAIASALAHLADQTSPDILPAALRLTVLPDALLLDGGAPTRVDRAVTELASLLHDRLVGEMTVHPGGDADAWRNFLLLLARTPDAVRSEGGLARLWTTMGGQHVELREIDYSEMLRQRSSGDTADWEQVLASCLRGDTFDSSSDVLAVARDEQRVRELVAELDRRATGGIPAHTAALVRLMYGLVEAAATDRELFDVVLRNIASALGHVSPGVMVELLSQRSGGGDQNASSQIIGEVVGRMSDQTVAQFIAREVVAEGYSTEPLEQAFHALVPDSERRHHLVGLAHDEAAASPLGQTEQFESLWAEVVDLLTSPPDTPHHSGMYGRVLTGTHGESFDIERVGHDPPERLAAWLGTVTATAVRALDLTLLLDLLRVEDDPMRWSELTAPVIAQIEDLLLVGDFDAAATLVVVLNESAGPGAAAARRRAARAALERLASGPVIGHIVSHLGTIDELQFARLKTICLSMGDALVRPLAEALSTEERGGARERLAALLIAFGSTGRHAVERLKQSPNPAVRRTAVYLLREFGGNDALPELAALLDDAEPQVQREAVRAILNIGTEAAYQILHQAISTGHASSREAIMQTVSLVRADQATPLFAYILAHSDHRGPLRATYVRAIESLGALRDPSAIAPLEAVLYRGEWWAPRRTAALRSAAAIALARIGTPAAVDILREAERAGSRRLRAAVRRALARATRTNDAKDIGEPQRPPSTQS
jgi:HEAT repeat protein